MLRHRVEGTLKLGWRSGLWGVHIGVADARSACNHTTSRENTVVCYYCDSQLCLATLRVGPRCGPLERYVCLALERRACQRRLIFREIFSLFQGVLHSGLAIWTVLVHKREKRYYCVHTAVWVCWFLTLYKRVTYDDVLRMVR